MRSYLIAADSTDAIDTELFRLSGRIGSLLECAIRKSEAPFQAALDDLLGAAYSLILAKHYEYTDRPKGSPTEAKFVITRANDMAAGKVRMDGKWSAGFYFNNALFRISAVYHRILKVVTNTPNGYVNVLLTSAQELYKAEKNRPWDNGNVKEIHDEVNNLKHDAAGIYWGRDVDFRQAICALDEVLDFIETTEPRRAPLKTIDQGDASEK